MLDLSTEFKNEMFNDNRDFLPFLDITLVDGTVLNLEKKDVWQNSFKVEDATSSSNTFTIGAAVTGKLSVILNNIYDKFSEYDFADAYVIAYVGLQLSSTLEKTRVGTYTIDDPSYDGSTISLSCLDGMSKFDKPYSNSTLKYPAKLEAILNDACTCCGISLVSANFPNKDYVVQSRPTDEALTFGDIVAMVAQIAGCWAKMDAYGRLKLGWYDMSVFEQNNGLDGGTFGTTTTPYSDGAVAYGGNFTDYSSGDSADGGTFADQTKFHHIYSTKSFSISTDDVVITGVRVTEEFEETETEKRETYLAGEDGYVIDVSGNALIQKGQAQAVANYLYGRVGGMRFRPLSVETLANPSVEAGDIAYVTDRKQNTYQSFISTRTFTLGGSESIACDAETPSRNNATKFSEMTKAVVKARNETKKQIGSYDLAVQQLTNLMTQSFGVFKSEEVLEDGSVIYYMHNKPERATSSTIWKMTADAFAVSTDGGKTWNAGIDSSGNAVVNILNAIGINADWINAGSLILGGNQLNEDGTVTVYDKNGAVLFKVSKDGIIINTENLKISQNGDIEVHGKVTGMDKVYIYNRIEGVDKPVIQYKWTIEDPSYEFLAPDGTVIMKTSEQVEPLYFPKETTFKKMLAKSVMIEDFVTSVEPFIGADGSGSSVSGKIYYSGVFVMITGDILIKSLKAGADTKFAITTDLFGGMGNLVPTRNNVKSIALAGSRVMVLRLTTNGELVVMNCGTDYTNSGDNTIDFRLDYTLI